MKSVNTERLRATTDASVWADEFAKICPDVDKSLMVGWFANAIETAKSLTREERSERDLSGNRDFVLVSRESLFEFLGEVALPPYGPDNDLGRDMDCAPIAEKIITWFDDNDLSSLYFP